MLLCSRSIGAVASYAPGVQVSKARCLPRVSHVFAFGCSHPTQLVLRQFAPASVALVVAGAVAATAGVESVVVAECNDGDARR